MCSDLLRRKRIALSFLTFLATSEIADEKLYCSLLKIIALLEVDALS